MIKPWLLVPKIRRYWRINITGFNDATYCIFSECTLKIAGIDQVPQMSSSTTNVLNIPNITVTDNQHDPGQDGWLAFDNTVSDASSWYKTSYSNPQTITVDFGPGADVHLDAYSITPRSTFGANYTPSDFTLDWSSDGTRWNTANIQTGLTTGWTALTERTFNI